MSNDDADKQAADSNDTTETPAAAQDSSAAEEASSTPSSAPPAEGASDDGQAAETAEPTLEEKLEQSKAATAKMKEKMLRVAADFENYRRRASREVEEARRGGTQAAVKDLLPVFDNLERATGHVDDKTEVESLVKGLEMVHKQFLDVLGKMGIERVAAVGEGFDPNVHESIQYEHSEEHAAGTVMTELQPGYRMGTMLLRPALVVVSRGPAPTEEAAGDQEASDSPAESDDSDASQNADGGAKDDEQAADEA
jgi:molecular chaperone GrpE